MNWYALLLCIIAADEILSAEDAFNSLEKKSIVRTRTLELLHKEMVRF